MRRYAVTLTVDPAAFGVCEPLPCWYDAAPALVSAGVRLAVAIAPGPVVVLGAVVGAVVAAVVVALGAVEANCTPITCSNDCSSEPNKFCAVAAGTCAAVELPESAVGSSCEVFLCPCGWALTSGSADDEGVKFAIVDM